MMKSAMSLVAAAALLGGCALADLDLDGSDATPDLSTTQYIGIADFPKIDQGQWYDAIRGLNERFAAGGAPEVPLTFGCAVTSKAGDVSDCAWTFAAGALAVDPATAAIAVDAPTFTCHVAAKTTATRLVAFLSSDADPLHDALPGAPAATPSIASQLPACFANPSGATPLDPGTGTTYVAASAYYTSAAGKARWAAAQAALVGSFDNVCGDSWCSGDMSDLSSLDLDCAVTKSTGNVKSCEWVFGGSYYTIAGSKVSETAKTFSCPLSFKGTLSQLIDVVTPPVSMTDPVDVIHRTLPGSTNGTYDELLGCLP